MTSMEKLGKLLKEMQETQKETQRQLVQLQRDVTVSHSEVTKKEDKTAVKRMRSSFGSISYWTTALRMP